MKYFYKLITICLVLKITTSNAVSLKKRNGDDTPQKIEKKSNHLKPLDCGILAPTIVNYGCLDIVWEKNYKRVDNNNIQFLESPKKVYATTDGGYIFASSSQIAPSNNGDVDYLVTKTDANGHKIWSKVFGTTEKDNLVSFVQTSDGGYILGGHTQSGIQGIKTTVSQGYTDIWLIKIDANGNKIWDKSFGGSDQDYLLEMISTSDGGVLLASSSTSPISGDKTEAVIGGSDAWIIKINGSGIKQWDKVFGGTADEGPRALSETNDGYVLGSLSYSGINGNKTSTAKGGADFWVVKIDLTGTKLWENSYGGSNDDIPRTINKNADGSLIISGYSKSPISGDKSQKSRGLNDIWIVKINSTGTKIWDKTIGGNNDEFVCSVTNTSTGNLIFNILSASGISGDKKHAIVSPNFTDQWLFEMTPDGARLWEKYLNGSSDYPRGNGDLIIQNNNLIILSLTDYKQAAQYDFWNSSLKKVSYCQAQMISSTTICKGKCATLVAQDCASGVLKWSNGEYGASICTSPATTQNYKSVCLSADSTCVGDSSAVFTVNVNASDAISISPSGFVSISACGQSQTITATGCANGTISWSNGLTGNPLIFVPTKNQAVKAICTIPNGCVSESDYLSISVYPISSPYISGIPTQGICPNTPVMLIGSGCSGGTLGWTGGLLGNSITINPSATVTIKTACALPNGCVSDSVQSIITVIPKPTSPTISNYSCLTKVWDKRFGGTLADNFTKIIKLSDGYLLAGSSSSENNGDKSALKRGMPGGTLDYWLVKVDNSGIKIWDKAYGGSGSDVLSDVIKLSDGNFMLVGTSTSGIGDEKSEPSRGGTDYWIIKIDANGNKIWDKTYGGSGYEDGNIIIKETNDGFLLGGSTNSGISGDKTSPAIVNGVYHFWILKLNPQGIKVWDKSFGGSGTSGEVLKSIELLENNEFLLLGRSSSPANLTVGNKTSPSNGYTDYWLLKINSSGTKIWDRSYGGSNYDEPNSMIYTNDGKVTIAGTSSSPKSGDKSRGVVGNSDIWTIRIDTSGSKIWDKTYGGLGLEETPILNKTSQNNYIITANVSLGGKGFDKSENTRDALFSNGDYWIMELNSNGEKLWDKTFGGTATDSPKNVIVENDALIIAGSSASDIGGDKSQTLQSSSPGLSDYWIVKMNYCQSTTSSSTTICKNDSTFLTAQGCPNASTVKWSNNETVQTISVKPSITTTYKAICISTELWACQSDSSVAFTVNLNTITPPTVNATNTNLCVGESITLTTSGCSGTYGWTGGATTTSITVSPTATKIYKVACTSNGCTSDSISITITVNPLPTKPTITTPSQNICVGGNIIISASGCSNGIYQWTGGLTGSSVSVSPTNAISTYKVACKVSNCVSDSSLAVTITTVAKPAMPTITPPTNSSICGGTNVSLTASACTGGTLNWTGGLTGTSITVAPISTKSYKVVCTINGCSSDSSSAVTITVNPKPAQSTISSTGNTVCQGTNVILTASACANGTYGWTGGLTTSSITISSLGTKSYKVACTVNVCTSDSSLVTTVQISTKPTQPVIVPPTSTTICQGTSVSLLANGCSGGTLGWTGGITSPSFTVVLPVGLRTYKVACTINGCTSDSSSAVTITVNPKPVQPAINQASQTICAGQSLNLTVTPVGGNTYEWTGGLTGTSIIVSPTATRVYKVAALANGCASDSSSSVIITVQATSASSTTTNATVCQGGTLTIGNGLKSTIPNCSGGSSSVTATYSGGTVGYDGGGSSGSNPTTTISGISSTITKVKVSIIWLKKGGGNATSCGTAHNGGNPYHGETSFRIQAPDGTILNLINSNTYGGSTTSTVTTVFEDGFPTIASGVPPVSGTFTPVSTLSGFNGKAPNGVWTLLPNDSGGGDPLCVSGFAVTITTNGATVPSTITWWDAQTSGNQVGSGSEYLPTTNTLALGTYTYYAQASCAGLCPSTRIATTLTVSARPATPTITPPTNSTICQGSSLTLSATGCTGGTYTWTGGLTGSSIMVTPTITTNYVVTCTVNNCVSNNSTSVPITVLSNTSLESIKSGSWTDPTTWSCNRVPISTDDVIINTGHTVTNSGGTIRAKTLNYRGGTLQISNTTNFILGN
jgi:hypothetical protein